MQQGHGAVLPTLRPAHDPGLAHAAGLVRGHLKRLVSEGVHDSLRFFPGGEGGGGEGPWLKGKGGRYDACCDHLPCCCLFRVWACKLISTYLWHGVKPQDPHSGTESGGALDMTQKVQSPRIQEVRSSMGRQAINILFQTAGNSGSMEVWGKTCNM